MLGLAPCDAEVDSSGPHSLIVSFEAFVDGSQNSLFVGRLGSAGLLHDSQFWSVPCGVAGRRAPIFLTLCTTDIADGRQLIRWSLSKKAEAKRLFAVE